MSRELSDAEMKDELARRASIRKDGLRSTPSLFQQTKPCNPQTNFSESPEKTKTESSEWRSTPPQP